MRNRIRILYIISVILVFIMIAIFHFNETVDETIARGDTGFSILTDYEVTTYDNADAPLGITQEYRWTLKNVPAHDASVTFYIVHQEIEVYVDNELLYSLKKSAENSISRTVGCDWAQVFLCEEDEGKEIRILVHPIYKSSIKNNLTIYYGDHGQIRDSIIQGNVNILCLGIAAILIGVVFIAFILVNIKNLEVDRSLFMLGMFSIFAGIWKISDMTAAPFIFRDSQSLAALAIISISMMVGPYIYFIRNQLGKEHHKGLDIVNAICILVTIALILLQLFGIADLRETLVGSHIIIIFATFSVLIALFRESKIRKFSKRLGITVFCCILCLLGSIVDMINFYYSGNSGNMIFCLTAFLIYAILMGYVSFLETKELMDRGQEATHYQKLAMHDELTGLFNRAHYSDFLEKNDVLREDCFIIMMDVNDLKICNDTKGHDWGDHLLIDSAHLIQKAFPKGICHRIGGDEFCILLCKSSEAECQECLKYFDELVAEFNKTHPEAFTVNIAYGYANHISKIDFEFSDTLRRADRMMYEKKLSMKTTTR